MVMGTCALCENNTKLSDSHIVPKYVGNWLKKDSVSGLFRSAHEPDKSHQDLLKLPLLCSACETLFSNWEGKFKENLFIPYLDKDHQSFIYKEWLMNFAISLAWRTATALAFDATKAHPLYLYVESALTCWKRYLLGQDSNFGPYEHHLIFMNSLHHEKTLSIYPNFHAYIMCTVDATPAFSSKTFAVYTKLPGMLFYSSIVPSHIADFTQTRIHPYGVMETYYQDMTNEYLLWFIGRRIEVSRMVSPSAKTLEIVRKHTLKDPQKFKRSRFAKLFHNTPIWQEIEDITHSPS